MSALGPGGAAEISRGDDNGPPVKRRYLVVNPKIGSARDDCCVFDSAVPKVWSAVGEREGEKCPEENSDFKTKGMAPIPPSQLHFLSFLIEFER